MRATRLAALVLLVGLLAGLLVLPFVGCSKDSSPDGASTADESFTEGVSYLEDEMADVDLSEPPWQWDVDMEEANAYFEDALDVNPDHCGALLLAAVTRLVMSVQDEELGEIMDDLFPEDYRSDGRPGSFLFRAFQRPDILAAARRLREQGRDELPFSELQDYIESHVVPALAYADAKMDAFENQDCVVVLEIEIEEKREVVEIEIDATDVYLLHGPLDVLQCTLLAMISYNMDVDEGQTLQDLMDSDPDFLALRPGGHMPAAFDELTEMYEHLGAAAVAMANETDPQDNDVFTNYEDVGHVPLGAGASDTLQMIADAIEDGLVDGVDFNPYEDFDEDAPDIDIHLDIEEMFTDPLNPITDYFPAHTWANPESMVVTEPIDMPDPTMSGILPGMTDQDWGLLYDWMNDDRW